MLSFDEKQYIIRITTAYAQGLERGQTKGEYFNPYSEDSPEWYAWEYGYEDGNMVKL